MGVVEKLVNRFGSQLNGEDFVQWKYFLKFNCLARNSGQSWSKFVSNFHLIFCLLDSFCPTLTSSFEKSICSWRLPFGPLLDKYIPRSRSKGRVWIIKGEHYRTKSVQLFKTLRILTTFWKKIIPILGFVRSEARNKEPEKVINIAPTPL